MTDRACSNRALWNAELYADRDRVPASCRPCVQGLPWTWAPLTDGFYGVQRLQLADEPVLLPDDLVRVWGLS
eukprot:5454417-Alexandrium_andersonii.AAC.1